MKSVAKGALSIVTHPGQTAKSVARGVVNVVDDTAESAISLGAWLLGSNPVGRLLVDKEWEETYKQVGARGIAEAGTDWIDRSNDALFGKRSNAGSQQFVEDVSQFLGGFIGAGKLKVFGKALSSASPVIGGAARGAVVDFLAFDPHKDQLAELAASSHVVGVRELGQLLSVEGDDSPVVARVKRSIGGLIPGVAIDGLVASARFFRGAKVLQDVSATPAAKQVAEEVVHENGKILQDIADGTHVSNDPVVVRPTAQGQFELALTENGKALNGNGPRFTSRAAAEGQAASINEALAARFQADAPVSLQQAEQALALAKNIEEAQGDPDKLVQLFSEARFNFSYMDAPEKVQSLLKSVGEVLSPAFDKAQGRPGIPLNESVDRALELAGMLTREDADAYFRSSGHVLKNADANILLLNSYLIQSGEHVAKWSQILDERPLDSVAQIETRKALQAYVNFAADVAGSNSGLGRGLNALKARGSKALKDVKYKGDAGAATPVGKELAPDIIAGMTASDLRDAARLFRLTKQPRVLFNTLASELAPVAAGRGAAVGRGMLEYFYNSILSAPATHAAIFVANGTVSAIEDGVRLLAGAVRRDPEMIREAADLLSGRLVYLRQSIKGMAMAFKSGHSIIDPRPIYKAIPGVAGDVIRTMGTRPIAAMDEFWRVNNNLAFVRMNSLKLARRDAARQNLAGDALDQFVSHRVDADVRASLDPSTGASRLPAAREFAAFPTFSSPLQEGSFGARLESLVQDHPFLVPVMPFVRTSVNVFDYSFLRSSPLGLFTENARKVLQQGGPEAAILGTRMAVGTTVWGAAGLLAFSGDLTGRGPSDPRLRKLWLASHQPYSVKIGGKWVSYRRLEPIATPLSFAADLAHIMRDNGDDLNVQEEGSKLVYALVAAGTSAMTNKTYLNGLVDFMDAIGSNSPHKVKNFIDGLVSAGVPNILQTVNADPYMRETGRLFDSFVQRVPGWGQQLPAKYNVFGEPVMLHPGRQQRAVNPFPVRDGTPMIEDEILQLHRAFIAPPTVERFGNISVNLHSRIYQNKAGSSLTPYERLMELVSEQNLRGQIEKLVDSPGYQRAGDGTDVFAGGRRYRELEDRIERVYSKAQRKMLSEYPDLALELKALDRARRASARSDGKAESILERIPR